VLLKAASVNLRPDFADTMAYTSSALSFLLEDLGKTVIVTGAQVPIGQMRNDAVENCLNSIILAGTYVIPGKTTFLVTFFSIEMTSISAFTQRFAYTLIESF
jgi:hypothetical protein